MDLKVLDSKLEQILREKNVAGMSVAVTDREKVIYQNGFGVLNIEHPEIPTTLDTVYRMASVTKIISGMTILSLHEKGVLDIDVPVKKYIPWLTLSRPESEEKITLRHLLSHTSGLPRGNIIEGSRDESTMEQALKAILPECEIESLPEEKVYKYSNVGLSLAGLIAATVTGKLYSELASEYVLKPLGMKIATFDIHEAATYPFSLPHVEDEQGNLIVEHYIRMNTMFRASGGLYSNTDDMCKLARCILNDGKTDSGNQIISVDNIRQMCSPISSAAADNNVAYYGLTMSMLKYKDRFMYGHKGLSSPYVTSVFTDKKSGYGVVTLVNTKRLELREEIPKMIFDMLDND